MKILIVGAGPTGLTAAVELARQGIIVDLVTRGLTALALGAVRRSTALRRTLARGLLDTGRR